jgi:hypothetical protein
MRRLSASPDERLIARLQMPPGLSHGVESLAYWHQRRKQLAWYRIRARREAARMLVRWEQRVGRALLLQPGVPIAHRTSAAVLIARTRLLRWTHRAAIATAAVGVILAVPVMAFVVLLTQLV